MTLTDFLLARIDEDEAATREVWRQVWEFLDPARVLAECEAKRRIVEIATADYGQDGGYTLAEFALDRVVYTLATPYSDHPDYRQEWKP